MLRKRSKEKKLLAFWDDAEILWDTKKYFLENPRVLAEDYPAIWGEVVEKLAEEHRELYHLFAERSPEDVSFDELLDFVSEEDVKKVLEENLFDILGESSYLDAEWDFFIDTLGEILKEKSPECYWYVEGEDLDWKHRSGYLLLETCDPLEFLRKILPDPDSHIYIYDGGPFTLRIEAYCHDVPMGSLIYCYGLSGEEYFDKKEELGWG